MLLLFFVVFGSLVTKNYLEGLLDELTAEAKGARDKVEDKLSKRYASLHLRYLYYDQLAGQVHEMEKVQHVMDRMTIDTNYKWDNKDEKLASGKADLVRIKRMFELSLDPASVRVTPVKPAPVQTTPVRSVAKGGTQ